MRMHMFWEGSNIAIILGMISQVQYTCFFFFSLGQGPLLAWTLPSRLETQSPVNPREFHCLYSATPQFCDYMTAPPWLLFLNLNIGM